MSELESDERLREMIRTEFRKMVPEITSLVAKEMTARMGKRLQKGNSDDVAHAASDGQGGGPEAAVVERAPDDAGTSSRYGYDYFNGRRVPPTVFAKDHVLSGTHQGTVHVEAGNFTLAGAIHGTLNIHRDVTAVIIGKQCGTVSVETRASVQLTGSVEGSVNVADGATLVVEAGGKLAGALCNDGLVIVRGVFGGPQSGKGKLRIEDGGYVKQPRIVDGVHHYDW